MPTYLELHRPREETVSVSASTDVHSGDYVCDGTADQVEINAALTYVSGLGGGSVVCLQGAYALAATVSVPANCTLKGVGWSTIFNYDAGGNCITIAGDNAKVRDLKVDIVAGAGGANTRPNCVYASGRTNLELFGLWLIGDETVADDGSDVRQCGVVFSTVTYSSIVDCICQDHMRHGIRLAVDSDHNRISENNSEGNTQQGIYLDSSDGNALIGNLCSSNAGAGIYLATSFDNTVSSNKCNGNGSHGIRLYASLGNTVTGNTNNTNSNYGIYLHGSSEHNTLTGNTCRGNANHGLYLTVSSSNTVTGNTCNSNIRHGIFLSGAFDNTVSGNTCNENDVNNAGTYDGISLSYSDNNLISENTCKNNDRWGIMVDDDSNFNKVSMNYTSGNTSGSIRVNNANCDKNQLEFNTVEEGAPGNVGTATRSYGNYDPSADAFVGDVGAAPF